MSCMARAVIARHNTGVAVVDAVCGFWRWQPTINGIRISISPCWPFTKLDAVHLPDKHRVAFSPPATLRCAMAKTVAEWITKDVAPTIAALGTSLNNVEILESFGCRPRNGVSGAQVSEHGHANALDVGSFKLANGEVVELTNIRVAASLREKLRDSACARFSTVLGNGADAYHDTHVHIDLMERNNHYKICQWDVLNAAQTASLGAEKAATRAAHELSSIPLPRPRPLFRNFR